MLYIHPPLAIAGYVFIFLFAVLLLKNGVSTSKRGKTLGLAAWLFTFLGLLTGMVWAQIAWGSYWSWDPKEVFTLSLFLTLSAGQVAFFEGKQKGAKMLVLASCVLVLLTATSSFIIQGLHSFL
jgi:ABC-type transport system involved in cytochrome c biogenesis permease subunit